MKNSGILALLCLCNIIGHPIKGTGNDAKEHLDNLSALSKPTHRMNIDSRKIIGSSKIDVQNDNDFSEESPSANTLPSTRRRQLVRQGTRRNLNIPRSNPLLVPPYDFNLRNPTTCTSTNAKDSTPGFQVRRSIKSPFNVELFMAREFRKMMGIFPMQKSRSLTLQEVDNIKFLGEYLRNLSSQNSSVRPVIEEVNMLAHGLRVSMLEYVSKRGNLILIHLNKTNFAESPYSLSIYPSNSEMGQSFEPSRQDIPLTIHGMLISLGHIKGGVNEFWRNISSNQYLALRGVLTYFYQRNLPFRIQSQILWRDYSPALQTAIRFTYFCFQDEIENRTDLTLPLFMNLYKKPIQLALNSWQHLLDNRHPG